MPRETVVDRVPEFEDDGAPTADEAVPVSEPEAEAQAAPSPAPEDERPYENPTGLSPADSVEAAKEDPHPGNDPIFPGEGATFKATLVPKVVIEVNGIDPDSRVEHTALDVESPLAVTLAAVNPEATDGLDEHGRLVLTDKPVEVSAEVAAQLQGLPFVKVESADQEDAE